MNAICERSLNCTATLVRLVSFVINFTQMAGNENDPDLIYNLLMTTGFLLLMN